MSVKHMTNGKKRTVQRTMVSSRALLLAVAGVLLSTSAVQAQSIEDALGLAYSKNADLLAARAQLRATDENVPNAYGAWLPTVQLTGEIGQTLSDTKYTDTGYSSDTNTESASANLSISQTVFNGGANFASLNKAENQVLAQRANLGAKEQEVLLAAATAYMDVVRDQAVVDLRQNNVEVLERQLEATRDRFQVGENTRTDVAQAEARLSVARADLRKAQGELTASRATYENVIGEQPGALDTPGSTLDIPAELAEVLELVRTSNPSITYRQSLADAADDDVDVAFAELMPTVAVTASAGRSWENGTNDTRTDALTVKGTLTVPLFQGGSEYASIRQYKQTASQRRLESDLALRNAVEQATQAWEQLQSTEAQIVSYQDSVRANEIALEGVRQEAAVGSRTLLEVLDAEQEALDARVDLITAERDRVVAAYTLYSSMGRLTAKGLALDVPLYDETEHYNDVEFKLIGTGID